MGSAETQYDGIKAFLATDQTEDLVAITVPTCSAIGRLSMGGEVAASFERPIGKAND
jgi:hypothetical protein